MLNRRPYTSFFRGSKQKEAHGDKTQTSAGWCTESTEFFLPLTSANKRPVLCGSGQWEGWIHFGDDRQPWGCPYVGTLGMRPSIATVYPATMSVAAAPGSWLWSVSQGAQYHCFQIRLRGNWVSAGLWFLKALFCRVLTRKFLPIIIIISPSDNRMYWPVNMEQPQMFLC